MQQLVPCGGSDEKIKCNITPIAFYVGNADQHGVCLHGQKRALTHPVEERWQGVRYAT